MHLTLPPRPWPTVISKMGMRRVRSRAMPRTSPIRRADFAGNQFLNGLRTKAIFITEGEVVKQVFNRG